VAVKDSMVAAVGESGHGLIDMSKGDAQKVAEIRFHTTTTQVAPLATLNEYVVFELVESPISASRLVQGAAGSKLVRYAALTRALEEVQVPKLEKVTVKQSGLAPPVLFVKVYLRNLNVPAGGVPHDATVGHEVDPTASSSIRLAIVTPLLMI
jgi:hypothetical protein